MIRLVGIAGSLRAGSYSAGVLRAAAKMLPPGVTLDRSDDLRVLPPYDEDLDGVSPPSAVEAFRANVRTADGLVIVTPEYNGSVPGVLKNAIDWLSRPFPGGAFHNLPAVVIGVTTGLFGAVWAQADLRRILGIAGAQPLDLEAPLARIDELVDDDGELWDPDARALVRATVDALVTQIRSAQEGPATSARAAPATP